MADLDDFLRRCHAYHSERGLACALLSRALNLLTLAFTVFFSALCKFFTCNLNNLSCLSFSRFDSFSSTSDSVSLSSFSSLLEVVLSPKNASSSSRKCSGRHRSVL